MSKIYRIFGEEFEGLDFSEESLLDMFNAESNGSVTPSLNNGFSQGKKWLNVQVDMWKRDLITSFADMFDAKKTLFIGELYTDKYPHWWLDSIFKKERK